MEWSLSDAKNRLSELANQAREQGPQFIRRRGGKNDRFVLLTEREYRTLKGDAPSLKRLLMDGPDLDGLDLTRDRSADRDVSL